MVSTSGSITSLIALNKRGVNIMLRRRQAAHIASAYLLLAPLLYIFSRSLTLITACFHAPGSPFSRACRS